MRGILSLFRFVGWRNLLLLLMGIAIFLLVRKQFFPDNPAKPRVTSLFDRVEYVRELRLVTFFSEELLEVGVQDALSRKVERQEETVENSLLLERQLQEKLIFVNAYATKAVATHIELERRRRELDRSRDSLAQNFRAVDIGRRTNPRQIQRVLNDNPTAFSIGLRDNLREWDNMPRNNGRRKKELEVIIEEMALRETEARRGKYEMDLAGLDRRIGQVREFLQQAKEEEKRAERMAKQSAIEAEKASQQYRQDTVQLQQLKIELRNQQTNPLPKLIAVVSTEVTAYVDLDGMTSDIGEGGLLLCGVTPARVDSNVRIKLSSENRFLTAKNLTFLATNKSEDEIQEGVYYHVYEEIKESIVEMKSQVISDAIARGILKEADLAARQYLEQMGRSLGFSKVQVLESCDSPTGEIPVIKGRSDSILQDTEDLRLRGDSLDAFLFDSLGIETNDSVLETDIEALQN